MREEFITLREENRTVLEQHRAVCNSKNQHYVEKWRATEDEAQVDVDNHLKNNNTHNVWIETKVTTHKMKRIN